MLSRKAAEQALEVIEEFVGKDKVTAFICAMNDRVQGNVSFRRSLLALAILAEAKKLKKK